jgi:hypothetical protein
MEKCGLYLDMDCIVLRSLHSLNNTIGTVKYTVPHWVETAQNDSQVQLARVSQELINFTIIFRQLYSMVTNKLGDGHEDLQTKRGGNF